MRVTIDISEISCSDIATVGGKCLGVARMQQLRFRGARGFVITSDVFEYFLKKNSLLEIVDHFFYFINSGDLEKSSKVANKIQEQILTKKIDADIENGICMALEDLGANYVAVRSSAVCEDSDLAAWAGLFDTYLNVPVSHFFRKLKKCWASFFSERALTYRYSHARGVNSLGMAVLVQEMIESDISGVAFSCHPVSGNLDKVWIEAGFGLGSAIVSGQVEVDSYEFFKNDGLINVTGVGRQDRQMKVMQGGGGRSLGRFT